MQVVALIHEENGAFGVSFPDFPGCTTVGSSADEAWAKAAEVLAFHVEGLAEDGDVPEPRTLSVLQADRQFKEDAAGALVVAVPYSPPSKAVRLNITMEEGLVARVDAAAQAAGESRSGFIAASVKLRMANSNEVRRSPYRTKLTLEAEVERIAARLKKDMGSRSVSRK